MNETNISFATLKVNGMKGSSTQNELQHLFNTYNFDIVFLQETHVDSFSFANIIKNKFQCEAFWSLGSNKSK